ncbi:MAG TPA: FliH/SctL family protein [Dermatophilaceae bacterium]
MTLSHEPPRAVVLRGVATQQARPARITKDLRPSPFGGRFEVDPRLTDPTLVAVVADAEERARAAGWERGRQEGRESAMREVAEQDRVRAARLENLLRRHELEWAQVANAMQISMADLDSRDAPVFQDIENAVAAMAVEIAEVLVGRHLEVGKGSALDSVRRALALAPRQSAAIVRLHPDAMPQLSDVTGALPSGSVTIVADASIEIGGCIVEAGNRTIDAQLGTALQRLRELLA